MKFKKVKLIYALFLYALLIADCNSLLRRKVKRRDPTNSITKDEKSNYNSPFKSPIEIKETQVNPSEFLAFNKDNKKFVLSKKKSQENVASITSKNRIIKAGWHFVTVESVKEGVNDFERMFLSGYLEGYLTAKDISDFHYNQLKHELQGEKLHDMVVFFEQVDTILSKRFELEGDKLKTGLKKHEHDFALSFYQIRGLIAGYKASPFKKKLDIPEGAFYVLQADGEIHELESSLVTRKNR